MLVYETPLIRRTLGCAIEVHKTIGSGLLESTYQRSLAREFTLNDVPFQEQLALPVQYKGVDVGLAYRIDFVIQGELLLELKSVDRILPVHTAQVLTYLRLLRLRQGFLVNFNVVRLMDGVRSILNAEVSG